MESISLQATSKLDQLKLFRRRLSLRLIYQINQSKQSWYCLWQYWDFPGWDKHSSFPIRLRLLRQKQKQPSVYDCLRDAKWLWVLLVTIKAARKMSLFGDTSPLRAIQDTLTSWTDRSNQNQGRSHHRSRRPQRPSQTRPPDPQEVSLLGHLIRHFFTRQLRACFDLA